MPKIRLLFLSANPWDTDRLMLDQEIRRIDQKIRASEYPHLVEMISVWAVEPDDLIDRLNRHKPHIVHFSGHGNKAGEIVVTTGNRKTHTIPAAALKALFETLKDNIR